MRSVDETLREMLPDERGRLVEMMKLYCEDARFLDKGRLGELERAIKDVCAHHSEAAGGPEGGGGRAPVARRCGSRRPG
jgi:hypothetical protein